ncbi:hypothetical protein [Rhizobium laguerreae]|uniref:hypothetical protein n=1 Tax=Rhizobium laguerreae TaxID=1076926 RepID=UPI003703F07C
MPVSASPASILIMLPNQRGCRHPFSIPEYSAGKAKGACVVSGNALRRFHLPRLARASYVDRATFSAEASKEIVPEIITANGIDAASLRTEVTPGGYLLKTNASLQTVGDLYDAEADRLPGSLGYVFRQYRVLTSRLNDTKGKTGFFVMRVPQGSLNATVAQKFFETADATKKGLGGRYAVLGDEQIFLNATNFEGKPFSGLDDASFQDGLSRAAVSFGNPKPKVSSFGNATVHFIGLQRRRTRPNLIRQLD